MQRVRKKMRKTLGKKEKKTERQCQSCWYEHQIAEAFSTPTTTYQHAKAKRTSECIPNCANIY
jgi:hypothetical protein